MAFHCPDEETLKPDGLAELQRVKFAAMLEQVREKNPFYTRKFADISFDAAKDDLTSLPFTTRHQIQSDQIQHRPTVRTLSPCRAGALQAGHRSPDLVRS